MGFSPFDVIITSAARFVNSEENKLKRNLFFIDFDSALLYNIINGFTEKSVKGKKEL